MSETETKKTPVKLRPILRKHQGKVTEPYRIMERLLSECPEFRDIADASIKLYWRKAWVADVDGVVVGAMCTKASERERLLAEEADEKLDLMILLPEETWGFLDDTEKEHRIYHELCHFAPAKDSNGDQKQDTRERPLWRLKRHPIVAFPSEVKRYGIDRVVGHNAAIMESIRHADRPMEKLFDAAEAKAAGNGLSADIRLLRLEDCDKFTAKAAEALTLAGIATVGALQDAMRDKPEYWAKDNGVGRYKQAAEAAINELVNENA